MKETDIEITDAKYKKYEKAWQYAMDMTKKEIHQGVEGLYHNLNTLKALLEVLMEGLGKNGVTSIFPCGIFQYKKGINDKPGTPNYDLKRLALESTAKRIYPNYANCDWSNNEAWVKQDRKMKQEYIDSLSEKEYNKLVEQLEKNPEIAEKLGLELV